MLSVKATIEFEDALYRQLKAEAALRGRKIKDLVADGVRHVLKSPAAAETSAPPESAERPAWFASLHKYAKHAAGKHDLAAMRASVAHARRRA